MIKWARKDETCVTSAAFTDLSQTISRDKEMCTAGIGVGVGVGVGVCMYVAVIVVVVAVVSLCFVYKIMCIRLVEASNV